MISKGFIVTLITLTMLSVFPAVVASQVTSSSEPAVNAEFNIKAAFLINFIRFTEWPIDAFSSSSAPFVLAIYGKDPFDRSTFDEVAKKPINGRRLEIRRIQNLVEIEGCQLLFINVDDEKILSAVADSIRNKHILSVGQGAKFVEAGGMIRFIIENTSVRFEINLTQAQRSDLKVSAKLLSLARVIR